MKRQATEVFFAAHPVFSLDEANQTLSPPGGKSGAVERLKYHLEIGRLKLIAREIYAVVPPGISATEFVPDPFLVASAVRPNCIFAYHSALELLGAAHSVWNALIVFDAKPRQAIKYGAGTIKFLVHPKALRSSELQQLGTRKVDRRGRWIRTTSPERTLVEGFRNPHYAGGLEELIVSASGFSVLDLSLLEMILNTYDIRNLWAATGWFLEQFKRTFHVPEEILLKFEIHRPRSPQYLIRDRRGGKLFRRWNIVLPEEVSNLVEPDAS